MGSSALPFDAHQEGSQPNVRVTSLPESTTHSVVSATGGILTGFIATNHGAAAIKLQLHDAASLPANTTVPLFSFHVGANTSLAINVPIPFKNGCVIAASSTAGTLTLDSSNPIHVLSTFHA